MKRKCLTRNTFNTNEFPFREIFGDYIEQIFGNSSLENIHKVVPEQFKTKSTVTVENDQNSWLHSQLYKIDSFYSFKENYPQKGRFIKLYDSFIKWLSINYFNESLIYQKKPTLRVHLVNNLSVGGYHRDSEYNHPKEEFNIIKNCSYAW